MAFMIRLDTLCFTLSIAGLFVTLVMMTYLVHHAM